MHKKFLYPLWLLATIPLGELHNFFHVPYTNLKNWFLLHPALSQDVEWYIKDTAEASIWIIFLTVWYIREKKRDRFWKWLILLFLLFRIVDVIAYWLNHRHAGLIYMMCYLLIFTYAGYNSIKEYKRNNY